MKKYKIQLLVFLVLFLVLEIALRIYGMKAGTLIDDFIVEENPVYEKRFLSDERGINHISASADNLMFGSIINRQGFRSKFDFTEDVMDSLRKNSNKEIVMIIGDSFVEGCCVDTVTNSFPDLLSRYGQYNVLNFGVAGTDPLQYRLIAEKYVANLRPDRVVVAFYFGNDILYYERIPTPGVPLSFPFKKNKWLFSVASNYLAGQSFYVLKTPEEAYRFFLEKYTMFGDNRNLFEKTIRYSVCFSKLYLLIEHKIAQRNWQKIAPVQKYPDANEIAYKNLKGIKNTCDSLHIPCFFVGIPAPQEAEEGLKLKEKYKLIFKELPVYFPSDITVKDYDGTGVGNHFNNTGHKKYLEFLKETLSKEKLTK